MSWHRYRNQVISTKNNCEIYLDTNYNIQVRGVGRSDLLAMNISCAKPHPVSPIHYVAIVHSRLGWNIASPDWKYGFLPKWTRVIRVGHDRDR